MHGTGCKEPTCGVRGYKKKVGVTALVGLTDPYTSKERGPNDPRLAYNEWR